MTEAEQRLWLQLRGRRLEGFKFKRQWTLGRYVVDFCCLEARLIVEVDGGQHNEEADPVRTAWLEAEGFRVRRNNDVVENLGGVLATLAADLRGLYPGRHSKAPEEA